MNTTKEERGAYKLKEALTYCGGVSESTIYRAIEQGSIRRVPHIRHILIPKAELDNWLKVR